MSHRLHRCTQIFSFYSYTQMRPIRSDYADFSTPLSPSCEEICSKIIPSFFTIKEGSTSHSSLSPQERGRKPPYPVLEPLRYKVGGPSKVSPGYAGWDRQGWNGDLRESVA